MTDFMQRLAGAPISWGVCEVPGWGLMLPVERVLTEMSEAGLRATELGPDGYLPTDPAERKALLESKDLSLVGGFIPVVLHRPELAEAELAMVAQTMQGLKAAGAGVAVVAASSGVEGYESATSLTDAEWDQVAQMIERLEKLADEHDLTLAIHPHVGTAILTTADVRRLLDSTSAKLCLDTGHLAIGGVDVLDLAQSAGDRVSHVHLKDVNLATAKQVSDGEISYEDAVKVGLYRPLGQGDVPIDQIVRALEERGYQGWYVLEQDAAFLEEPEGLGPVTDVIASVDFLRRLAAAPVG